MNAPVNPMQTYPYPAQGAMCPLLVAVWPLRYAIGADQSVDADALGLPPLTGTFPTMESGVPSGRPLQYSRRLLRDGWLYVWLEGQSRLVEYTVNNAYLTETERGGPVIDHRQLPYFIIPAGEVGKLVWSPVQWEDAQFAAAKSRPEVQNRIMRNFAPGQTPNSDYITRQPSNLFIADYLHAEAYEWSVSPVTASRPDLAKTIFAMNHCEQQAWAMVDDPWAIAQDLASLTRLRQEAHESYLQDHAEDWATAGVLRSLAHSDVQLGQKMNQIANTRQLNEMWQAMGTLEDRYTEDIASLTACWADWILTVHGQGPASLATACGHFDISAPSHRDALEDNFAAACLEPSDKPNGIIAIRELLTVPTAPQKPWFLWALLGLKHRLNADNLASLLDVSERVVDAAPEITQTTSHFARALTLSAAINLSANKLAEQTPATARPHLLSVTAPAAALSIKNWPQETDPISKTFMAAALTRSGHRLKVVQISQREAGLWLGEIIGSPAPVTPPAVTPPSASGASITHFTLTPDLPEPPNAAAAQATRQPASLPKAQTLPSRPDLLNLGSRALQDAPVRSVIAVLAAVNLAFVYEDFQRRDSISSQISTTSNVLGAGFGVLTAIAAIGEKLTETNWKHQMQVSGALSNGTRIQLIRALDAAAATQALSGAVSAFNIISFGTTAVDAYRHGDLNTAGIDAGLVGASAAQLALQVKAYRTYRLARAAVLLGEVAALRAGTSVLGGPLTFALTSLAALIVSGVIIRQHTQDTPLERWVANSRFGVNPAPWSRSHRQEMEKLYALLYPVTLNLERYPELDPRTGSHIEVTWLILRLVNQKEPHKNMLRFEGEEIWSGSGWSAPSPEPVKVSWTEADFDTDAGTRRPREPGVVRRRRVYHPTADEGRLTRIEGTLYFSPIEGFELPPIEIKDSAWI